MGKRAKGLGFSVTFRVTFSDELTIARLMEMADICHVLPEQIIAALTAGVLEDDALMHNNFVPESITVH
jgi:hypothetical protein